MFLFVLCLIHSFILAGVGAARALMGEIIHVLLKEQTPHQLSRTELNM